MEDYFSTRENLRAVIQVVDFRHKPSLEDQEMSAFLWNRGIPVLVVAKKSDKIARGQWSKYLKVIAETLELPDCQFILPYSAETGIGVEELHQAIEEILNEEESEDE